MGHDNKHQRPDTFIGKFHVNVNLSVSVSVSVSMNVYISVCRIHQKHTRPNKRGDIANVTIDRLGHLGYMKIHK